uniref:Uncharacterized protein n=1 Tax=Oryza meridionalis TaxID=40149 RepID=A0A0E0CC52_9ORYZ
MQRIVDWTEVDNYCSEVRTYVVMHWEKPDPGWAKEMPVREWSSGTVKGKFFFLRGEPFFIAPQPKKSKSWRAKKVWLCRLNGSTCPLPLNPIAQKRSSSWSLD